MIEHSQTPVTLNIGGTDHQFGRLVPKDILDVIQWANDRERKLALELIPTENVEDRIKVFKACGNRYTASDINELLTDSTNLCRLLFICYRKANPDATEEAFYDLFGMLDVGMMEAYVDAVSGFSTGVDNQDAGETGNPPMQMADSAGQPLSPPSANEIQG
jgi:hypothetical protein